MRFHDHFSAHAAGYAQGRPDYPAALFDWLAAQCPQRRLAWDAGCGNGQATLALAPHFARVLGTDPSAAQIAQAAPRANVEYRVEPAEQTTLAAHSVDAITAAQAFHWFDHARFFAEVRRVAAPGARLALWTYGLSRVDPAVDAEFMHLYDAVLGPYWPPERRHVENGYAELPFPFEPLAAPDFAMQRDWTLAQYLTYVRSWSAAQRYLRETGRDAVAEHAGRFARAWGDPAAVRRISWPLSLRVGAV
jgi:SAM-dependent methyltransferase